MFEYEFLPLLHLRCLLCCNFALRWYVYHGCMVVWQVMQLTWLRSWLISHFLASTFMVALGVVYPNNGYKEMWRTSLIAGPHQKPQQLQSPKTPALCFLQKYRAGISVGWSYWSGWKKGGSLATNNSNQLKSQPCIYGEYVGLVFLAGHTGVVLVWNSLILSWNTIIVLRKQLRQSFHLQSWTCMPWTIKAIIYLTDQWWQTLLMQCNLP